MADAQGTRTATPWELKLASGLPVGPWLVGALASLGLFAGFLGFRWLAGFSVWETEPGGGVTPSTRLGLYLSLMVGYMLAAARYRGVSAFRDLQALGLADRAIELRRDEGPAHRVRLALLRRSRRAGAGGVLVALLLIELLTRSYGAPPLVEWTTLHSQSYTLPVALLVCWMLGRGIYGGCRRRARFPGSSRASRSTS